jgi:hypothetical protein
MAVKPGDRIVMRAKTKRLAPSARQGEILEVLSEDPGRYVVRWGDGRTTTISPLPDSIRIEPAKASRKR